MEEVEIVARKEELQMWIKEKVKSQLISSGVLEKYNLLQSLLKRREEQATRIQALCESVAALETVVKRQYTLMGLEYIESDSETDDDSEADDDDKTKSIAPPELASVQSGNKTPTSPATKPLLLEHEDGSDQISPTQKPVVTLTRLSRCQPIRSACSPVHQSSGNKSESSSDADSDPQWEPDHDLSDSEYSLSSYGSRKRKKINHKDEKPAKKHVILKARRTEGAEGQTTSTPKTSTESSAKKETTSTFPPNATVNTKSNKEETLKSPAGAIVDTKSNTASTSQTSTDSSDKERKTTTSPSEKVNTKSTTEKTLTSAVGATVNMKSNTEKKSTSPTNTNGVNPSKKGALSQTSGEATNTQASKSQVELSVNTDVLARMSAMKWLHAKILELIPTDDKTRYKVSFENKKKKIVSGHHIAVTSPPKVERLSVGCRVVMKCGTDPLIFFAPGTLAEMPTRRNSMRFLIFTDDHKPRYVGLPSFHQVFRQLEDPLDDIPDGSHKDFMRTYVASWPYPSQTSYRVGQVLEAEYENVQQKCKVLEVHCSLIRVVFEKDEHQEWIYRGSIRLQHMINMQEQLQGKGVRKKSTGVKESSKSTK
ncbi:histone-lysine N-methyltransferase SETDB1-A [Xyrichtys novacula]|uniref:Histone-lysine N-methyltransferase SETDB1-A n=1 Tax=Xyrichtys novacula TaxID=13765 RepID=A0AAV1HCD8_XYRNO|nr:histone-lysine N-methyltransferase SETDB1-A [Xyrichtys novacula]